MGAPVLRYPKEHIIYNNVNDKNVGVRVIYPGQIGNTGSYIAYKDDQLTSPMSAEELERAFMLGAIVADGVLYKPTELELSTEAIQYSSVRYGSDNVVHSKEYTGR